MAILNFFFPPLSPAMQTRTRIAHVTRGFCFYIQQLQQPSLGDYNHLPRRHPMALPLTLGLLTSQRGIEITKQQAAGLRPLSPGHVNHIFMLAARYWTGQLRSFNANGCIDLPLAAFDEPQRIHILELAAFWLHTVQHLPTRKERNEVMKHSDTVPPDILARLDASLAALEASLLEKDAQMPMHLRNTHSLLISYPETVHLLEDSEIERLIDAAELHTKTEIVKAAAAGKSTGGARKKVSIDDL